MLCQYLTLRSCEPVIFLAPPAVVAPPHPKLQHYHLGLRPEAGGAAPGTILSTRRKGIAASAH